MRIEEPMKYFVVSYLWKECGNHPLRPGVMVVKAKCVMGVYAEVLNAPKPTCITHIAEITEEQAVMAEEINGF